MDEYSRETVPLSEARTLPLREIDRLKASFLPPALAERYQVRRVLGKGGFGIVFLAEDKVLGRLVGIKQLFDDFAGDDVIRQRFLQEARIAGRLEHPNIIIVYNIEEGDDRACLVMEYLGGGSLDDLIETNGQLDVRTSIQIMLGVLTGLDAAHSIQVVHRDIKPQNILFGIGSAPKITDFGIAHLPVDFGGSETIDDELEYGSLIGTPVYMAPEQVLLQPVDARADLYSAGAVFHQMLTGRALLPVHSEMRVERIREIVLNEEPASVREFRDDVPRDVEEVLTTLVAKRADDRYPDAVAAKKALIQAMSKLVSSDDAFVEEFETAPISSFLNSPAAILKDIIHLLLIDGRITDEERAELNRRAERLGFSEVQTRAIEEELREEMDLPSLG